MFFNHSLDELDLGSLDVDDPPLALEEALELRWEDIALEVERRRALQRARDGLGELRRMRRREHDLLDCRRARSRSVSVA